MYRPKSINRIRDAMLEKKYEELNNMLNNKTMLKSGGIPVETIENAITSLCSNEYINRLLCYLSNQIYYPKTYKPQKKRKVRKDKHFSNTILMKLSQRDKRSRKVNQSSLSKPVSGIKIYGNDHASWLKQKIYLQEKEEKEAEEKLSKEMNDISEILKTNSETDYENSENLSIIKTCQKSKINLATTSNATNKKVQFLEDIPSIQEESINDGADPTTNSSSSPVSSISEENNFAVQCNTPVFSEEEKLNLVINTVNNLHVVDSDSEDLLSSDDSTIYV